MPSYKKAFTRDYSSFHRKSQQASREYVSVLGIILTDTSLRICLVIQSIPGAESGRFAACTVQEYRILQNGSVH